MRYQSVTGDTMPLLHFDITADGPTGVVIAVTGEIDMAAAPELAACLLSHADRDVTVDLSGVGFLDSTGISALIVGYNALRDAGHSMRTTGEQEHVQRLLEVTGLTAVLHDDADGSTSET